MNIISFSEAASTNAVLKQMSGAEAGTVISCHTQTAGRGQRGNSWEAEPGKNLTFSILLRPQFIKAAGQFAISRAVALAVADCLNHWMSRDDVAVKWPNDIYVGDKKICGILIENSLEGDSISRVIAGVGINVNQREFRSDAPNPISMWQLTGVEYDLDTLLRDVASTIEAYVNAEDASGGVATRGEYRERLWRGDGYYPYRDADGEFEARITDVDSAGFLTLERRDGTRSKFAFKEVSAVITPSR